MRLLYATFQNLLKIPVRIVGWFIVPLLWFYKERDINDMPSVLMPWVNPEDWTGGYRGFPPEFQCMPQNVRKHHGFWDFFWYHAMRNGGDGLRNYDWHVAKINPEEIEVEILPNGYNVYQGKFGSWFRQWGKVQVKYGFRMIPEDKLGFNPRSYRHLYGSAPTSSFRIREA